MRRGRVSRWHSGVVASLVLVAAGALLGLQSLLVASIVPITYLGYAALSSTPDPEAVLTVERDCTPQQPLPGERVEVTLTVENDSSRTLPDVRIVDRVPDGLEVVEGTAKRAVPLRASDRTELTYTVRPQRGTYTFDEPWIRLRSLSATAVATASPSVAGDADLECTISLDGFPIDRQTIALAGAVASDSGGPGFEFHSTREYRHGDPLSRIDWRRYARTGDLGTVQYRKQEAAKIVVIVDGRAVTTVAPEPGRPDGTTLTAYTGIVTSSALVEVGHSVGMVGLGIEGEIPGVYTGPPAYVEPGAGVDVGGRIARVCDAIAARGSDDSSSSERPVRPSQHTHDRSALRSDSGKAAAHLETLLPADAQLVVCTPAVDDAIVDLTLALRRRGFHTTTISPDVTDGDDVGARLAGIERQARLERLRRLEVSVVDWNTSNPLVTALSQGLGEVVR
ncbi:DUF58 domain-containing protein [Natronobacterium gregoryi]|uniref:Conserved repeat protein n=2 Tax=Natronobacterium gregoryi TaxID=44930 RepID=L0AGM0_NATGS|nr:DUF58 domain-containing protein [Natronobacterium gregoryi]AFZ72569.1 conserved repeat protein [Natronobacterium gregoryi SP2]ELY71912.1 hypothetical protein C490_04542 [Natronobacterium gregoryi SP2]PLK19350.1 DUF58 domain-containing protein [Natronobacterium gregoryi SP2]SFJ52247.1 conserved repeat domain-containing protein [Natronobacterium gregoryi]